VNAARYPWVADIRDVDLSSPVRIPVDGVYRAKQQTETRRARVEATLRSPIAAIDKCDCHAGKAWIMIFAPPTAARAPRRSTSALGSRGSKS
jgi:hypothetical protein